jgi:hypothetical protein
VTGGARSSVHEVWVSQAVGMEGMDLAGGTGREAEDPRRPGMVEPEPQESWWQEPMGSE